MKDKLSIIAFFAAVILIIGVTFSYPRWEKEKAGATISWDVSGYYIYLPAFLIYGDAAKLDFFEEIRKKYQPSPIFDQAYKTGNGNYIFKYSGGMALLYLPSFLVGHTIAGLTDYPADGYSVPYQASLYLGSVLFGLLGLWIMRRNLLHYFSDKVTALMIIFIAFGTNYLNYVSIDAAMPHNYLFTLYAFLIYFSINFYRNPTYATGIFIGLSGGLAALSRPTEALMMLIPILWGLQSFSKSEITERLLFWKKHLPKILAAITVYGMIGFLQLFYWKMYSGNWLEYSYGDQGFSWLKPHFENVFFSYRKGWLIYTPIMALTFGGFWFLFKKYRSLFWVTTIFFIINTWIISAWDIWWYGGGFGQRAFIQSFPLTVFLIAAFTEYLLSKNWSKIALGIFTTLCISLNLFQTWQAHWGPFDTLYMTKTYYWRIFGAIENNPCDKFLLDTKHDFRGEQKNVKTIFETDFENSNFDSLTLTKAKSGMKAIYVNGGKEFATAAEIQLPNDLNINNKTWLRATGQFYCKQKEWDVWRMPQFNVRLKKGGEILQTSQIRPHRVLSKNQWKTIWIDIPLNGISVDNIEIFLWNAGGRKDLILDDLVVEVYEE